MKRIVFFALLLALPAHAADLQRKPQVWHPELVKFDPPGERGLEFGSALSPAGYNKLKAALKWEEGSSRTDYNFDGFDGKRFVLLSDPLPLKARIKVREKGPRWQVSRFVSKDRVQVGALSVKVHVTESWDGKLKGKQAKALLAAADDYFARLDAGGAPLRAAGDKVDALWKELKDGAELPGERALDHYLSRQPCKFYPTKRTLNKRRLEAALPGFKDPGVTLMLGSEDERNMTGKVVTVYELEAEADGPLTPAQTKAVATAIGSLMAKAGLKPADAESPMMRGWAFTVGQLTK